MTLSTTTAIKEYTGDGSTVNFSFPYLVFQSSHLTITVDGVANTDWVAATYGAGAGVTVTFTTAPANGTDIIIRRIVPFTQTTDFENFDGNPADVTEKQFDLCVMQAQQLDENLDRALVVPVGTNLTTNIISGTIDSSTRVLTLTSSGPALSTVAALDTDITTVLTSVASGDLLQYDGASWVNKDMGEIIDGLTAVTAAAGDKLVIADVSDSNNPKEITVQGILDLAGVTSYTVNAQTGVTLTLLDYIGIADTSDSSNNKKALVSDIFGLINGITADTTPAVGDYIVTNDVSDSNNPKAVTVENLYKTINGLTEDTTPVAGADYVVTYDASAGTAKKVLLSNLISSSSLIVQAVNASNALVVTGSAQIPNDDTIPQNTEGLEAITCTITPTNASNKLRIRAQINIATASSNDTKTAALFQDSTADALHAVQAYSSVSGDGTSMFLEYVMVAGTTSATTFKVRAAGESSVTVTINGSGGSRKLGGILACTMTIEEIKV